MHGATQIMFTRKVMVMLLLASVLHLTGFVTPGWFYITENNNRYQIGLWYGIICEEKTCVAYSIFNLESLNFKFQGSEPWSGVLKKYQALGTVALFASLMAILTDIVHRKTTNKALFMWSAAICILCIFMSGVLGLVTAIHFANIMRYAEEYHKQIGEESPYGVPYSIIFTGLGGLVPLINYTVVAYNVAMDRDRK